jgi:hypothetical protein
MQIEETNLPETACASDLTPVKAQLLPFNEWRFDDCMAYLSSTHGRALSVYEMMKLHVMIDVHHTIFCGKPAIGGTFSAFTNGPVSRSAKARVQTWKNRFAKTGEMPDGFLLREDAEDRVRFVPTDTPDEDDFSQAELRAMNLAWRDVVEKLVTQGWDQSQRFFHADGFIGKAWKQARQRGLPLDWNDILDEYAIAYPHEDVGRAKALLGF